MVRRMSRMRVAVRLVALGLIGLVSFSMPTRAAEDPAALIGRGIEAFRVGDLLEATKQWREAARLCRIDDQPALEADALSRLAEADRDLGQIRDAIASLDRALALARRTGDAHREAAVLGALGNARFIAQQPAAANEALEQSLTLARAAGFGDVIVASANDLGNYYASQAQPEPALRSYAESIAAAQATGPGDAVLAMTNAARVLAGQRRDQQAYGLLRRAADAALRSGSSSAVRGSLVAIGLIAKSLDRRPAAAALVADTTAYRRQDELVGGTRGIAARTQAAQVMAMPGLPPSRISELMPAVPFTADESLALSYRTLQRAAEQAQPDGDMRSLSLANGYLGQLYEQRGRAADALTLTERAIAAAQRIGARDLLYRWQWQQGRLLVASGERQRALAAYRRAFADLAAIRIDMPVVYRDGRSSFRETIEPMFIEFVDQLLQESSLGGAQQANALVEVETTLEALKVAELQDYFRDECALGQQGKIVAIEAVASDTAIIYPVVLRDRLDILVTIGRERRHVTTRVPAATLLAEIRRFRSLVEDPASLPADYLASGARIYDWLIRPLEPSLAQAKVSTLVFVPDGALRTIPLAALYDGGQFLVERFAIATEPGLGLIDPQPFANQRPKLLIAALSQKVVDELDALPGVLVEASKINGVFPGTSMIDENFKAAAFAQEMQTNPYTMVHIATHGTFGDSAEDSFILAYDQKLSIDDLERVIKTGSGRTTPLELLTLSACQTAKGDDRAPLGLAGVAVRSGARSSVASLWYVSDAATATLMAAFYQALKQPGISKTGALRAGQRALIADARARHPFLWAPFILIGNWL